ncbi:hypothetical protein NHN26_15125 [Rhodovulum tesquicola]|uniref:hypothetical protein n=1 Tax=Rhodovulum tesquicola TaxID=540254 RepID=UPI002096A101|nr:hypothetical protein [Rhodovulum tesquicola]MCO8146552.1 hypothetical protein [Rhodovulum tesquicola]
MTWTFDTGAKYHTQDTNYYCGAACAMMVLAEIGLPYTSMNQDDLYNSNHNHNVKPGWATDPYGLQFTMMDRKPAAFTNSFVVYKPTTEAEGTQKVVYTLWRYQVSPITLVYGCMHWIVVRGVQTDVEPTPGTPYSVLGLWVNNPVHRNNAPHGAGDVCGSGGVNGVEAQWVSYASWQSTYFTGCDYDSGTGTRQYISVCDPEPPRIELPRRPKFESPFNGRELIRREEALRMVSDGIDRYRLHDGVEAMRKLRQPRFEEPVLVKRLDRLDEYYYLAPAMMGGEVHGYAQVDALFGDLQGVSILAKPARPYDLDRERVAKRAMDHVFSLRDEFRGRFRLRPDTFCVSPTMVWRPCRESYSPHLPFWQITAGTQTVYVRADGEMFTSLTTGGTGV